MRVGAIRLCILTAFITFGLIIVCSNSRAQKSEARFSPTIPKTWDEAALADWATPLAGLNLRPTHISSKEYYSLPVENLLAPLVAPARAADVTGTWRVTISTSDGAITGQASLKQTGDNVTGWVGPDENDPIPVTGILKGNKLTLRTFPQPGRTAAFDKCELTVNGDKMVGTIDTDKGKIELVKSTP